MVRLFKAIVCLFLGHKRLYELKDDEHSPFGVGGKDFQYYPMWPCDRCGVMYIERNKIATKSMWVKGNEIHRSDI